MDHVHHPETVVALILLITLVLSFTVYLSYFHNRKNRDYGKILEKGALDRLQKMAKIIAFPYNIKRNVKMKGNEDIDGVIRSLFFNLVTIEVKAQWGLYPCNGGLCKKDGSLIPKDYIGQITRQKDQAKAGVALIWCPNAKIESVHDLGNSRFIVNGDALYLLNFVKSLLD